MSLIEPPQNLQTLSDTIIQRCLDPSEHNPDLALHNMISHESRDQWAELGRCLLLRVSRLPEHQGHFTDWLIKRLTDEFKVEHDVEDLWGLEVQAYKDHRNVKENILNNIMRKGPGWARFPYSLPKALWMYKNGRRAFGNNMLTKYNTLASIAPSFEEALQALQTRANGGRLRLDDIEAAIDVFRAAGRIETATPIHASHAEHASASVGPREVSEENDETFTRPISRSSEDPERSVRDTSSFLTRKSLLR